MNEELLPITFDMRSFHSGKEQLFVVVNMKFYECYQSAWQVLCLGLLPDDHQNPNSEGGVSCLDFTGLTIELLQAVCYNSVILQ